MKNKFMLLAIATLVLSASGVAQKKTVFTSVYTSLAWKSCKVLRGTGGTDDAKLCTGPGGYKVRVYSSATMTHIVAEYKKSDNSYPLASVDLDFNDNRSKVEWRLANGKPFAAILRVPTYGDPDEFGAPGKKTGEQLVVVGLNGQDDLSATIDAKTPNANVKAREAADAGYKAP